jgi:hypothetical protein
MAGVSAYAALGRKLLAPAPCGSTRRLRGCAILRAEDNWIFTFYIAVQRFLEALEDSVLSFEINLRKPKTLNKALNKALRIQTLLKVRSENDRKNVRFFRDDVSYDDAADHPQTRKMEQRQASLPKGATVTHVRKASVEHTQEHQNLLAEITVD